MALNGGIIGVAAAWCGFADIILAADSAFLQIPFSSLGLVPEAGTGVTFPETMGIRLATEVLAFGRKITAQEMLEMRFINRVFPTATFQKDVDAYLNEQLAVNDAGSMLVAKKLLVQPRLQSRLIGVTEANNELSERFITGIPAKRFAIKAAQLAAKRKSKL
ncbi:hypothetical protein HDU93_007605 [Gonapodya sp. JEL0774]|nr:hypothetical protein HDU93_007605 [Gonapodya sp. JEL0774]